MTNKTPHDEAPPPSPADEANPAEVEASAPPQAAVYPRPAGLPEDALRIDSIDLDAQGIARRPDGKVVFIDGALPTEIADLARMSFLASEYGLTSPINRVIDAQVADIHNG